MKILKYKIKQNQKQNVSKKYINKLQNDYNDLNNERVRILNNMKVLQEQAHELNNLMGQLPIEDEVNNEENYNRR